MNDIINQIKCMKEGLSIMAKSIEILQLEVSELNTQLDSVSADVDVLLANQVTQEMLDNQITPAQVTTVMQALKEKAQSILNKLQK